jgi:hypothetical protein
MKHIFEVDLVHRRWELISEETKVLDVATCAEERKILALVLEDKRLQLWGTFDQYNRVYLPAVQDLHDKHYSHCLELASKIKIDRE